MNFYLGHSFARWLYSFNVIFCTHCNGSTQSTCTVQFATSQSKRIYRNPFVVRYISSWIQIIGFSSIISCSFSLIHFFDRHRNKKSRLLTCIDFICFKFEIKTEKVKPRRNWQWVLCGEQITIATATKQNTEQNRNVATLNPQKNGKLNNAKLKLSATTTKHATI